MFPDLPPEIANSDILKFVTTTDEAEFLSGMEQVVMYQREWRDWDELMKEHHEILKPWMEPKAEDDDDTLKEAKPKSTLRRSLDALWLVTFAFVSLDPPFFPLANVDVMILLC